MSQAKSKAVCSSVPLDPLVGRLVERLRERASRKWTDEANRSASLFGQAADEIERLREALIEARAAHVLRTWDEQTLARIDAALVPNVQLNGAREPATTK